jgi:hypothetical protein
MTLTNKELEKKTNELLFSKEWKKWREWWSVTLKEQLFWWVVSWVYNAVVNYKKSVFNIVVKITEKHDISPKNDIFSDEDIDTFSLAPKTAILDYKIQEILSESWISLPKTRRHQEYKEWEETYIIDVMDHFWEKWWYETLQNLLLTKKLPQNAWENLWKTLAQIRIALENNWKELEQVENPEKQFKERFDELKILYNKRMDIFREIQQDFLSNEKGNINWTDGDQKNFAVNEKGEVLAYDFWRSISCDPDFMLPNLLGHIALFYIGWYLNYEDYKNIFNTTIKSFKENYKDDVQLNEQKFVNYFTASLIHRGMALKWIDPKIADNIKEDVFKGACYNFADTIFGTSKIERTTSIKELMKKLEKVGNYIEQWGYKWAF